MPVIKTNRTQIVDIFISPLNRQRGLMRLGQWQGALSLGRNGCVFQKVEGDGATPICDLRPIRLYVRPDRHRLRCPLRFPWQMIRKEEGWCDSVSHGSYNRRIKRPFAHSHEEMWRDDRLYDVVIETDWNHKPRKKGRGSAIFIHCQREDQGPTAGCLAFPAKILHLLIGKMDQIRCFRIHGRGRKPIKAQN